MKKLFIAIVCVCLCANVLLFFPSSAAETVDLTLGGLIEADLVESAGHQYISSNYENVLDAVEFVNEDGTRTVYTFGNPIKYIDSTGAVKRIDTTLIKERGNVWKNQANFFDVAISEDSEQGVTVSYQDNTLTAVPAPVLSDSKVVSQSKKVEQTTEKAVRFSDSEKEITYQSTYTGYATRVALPIGTASYVMTVSGDIADISVENNTVRFELKNGGQVEYVLTSLSDTPHHWSASDVQTTVSQSKDGYRVQYTVNETVLSEVDSLQLTVETNVEYIKENFSLGVEDNDPNTETLPYQDVEVYSYYPNNNYGSLPQFWVGRYPTLGICRTYVYFDVEGLNISYDRILSANYRIYEASGEEESMQVEAYMVTQNWNEMTMTWNNKPTCDGEKLTVVNIGRVPDDSAINDAWRYCDFYITKAVMAWKQGIPNYGIMLKSRTEDSGTVNNRTFYSHDSSTDFEFLPHLSITYVEDETSMANIGVENGSQYYIKNKNSGLYLTSTGSNGYYYATQVPWSGANSQKWTVQCDNDGCYKLIPQNATNQVLSVCDNDDNDREGIELAYPNSSTGQQFKFVRNWDGSYQILTRESNFNSGLRVEEDDTAIGAYIGHLEHTVDWVKSDDWTLEAVQKGDADVYSFQYPSNGVDEGLNTLQYDDQIRLPLEEMGYISYPCNNSSAEFGYYWLSKDSIWIFNGHGASSRLNFVEDRNEDGVGDLSAYSYITAADTRANRFAISEKPHNDLAQLQLALFASCRTGLDEGDTNSNLIGMMCRKGAHFAIASTDIVYTYWGSIWTERFFYHCLEGHTIYDAMCLADDDLYSEQYTPSGYEEITAAGGNIIQRHTLGDNSLCLYPEGQGEIL